MVDDRLNDVSNKIILLSIRRLVATVNDYFCWTLEFEIIRFLITRSQSQRDCLSVEVGQLEIQEPTTIAIHVVYFYGSNDAVVISVKQYGVNEFIPRIEIERGHCEPACFA